MTSLARTSVLCVLMVGLAYGQEKGTSNVSCRLEASNAIPYHALRPDVARQIHSVVNNPSIYRRMPVCAVDCDPEMFTFLVRNPDVVTAIWERMGITELSLGRLGPYTFQSTDGMGTTCTFQLVCGSPQLHLYYGSGYYEGNLLKHRISGRSVMLLRSLQRTTGEGMTVMVNTLDVFVTLDNGTVDLAAKTVSPLFVKAADENFLTTSKFLSQLSRAAGRNAEGMHRLSDQLTGIDHQVRSQFVSVVDRVAAGAAQQHVATVRYAQTSGSDGGNVVLMPHAVDAKWGVRGPRSRVLGECAVRTRTPFAFANCRYGLRTS